MPTTANRSHLRVGAMATVSGKTITGTSQNDEIRANRYVSDNLRDVEILGGDGDDVLSDFISKSRITSIYGGNGNDFMSASSYSGATFASFFIDGDLGSDIFFLPGKSSGTPILTRKLTGTEIQYNDIDGGKLTAYVSDTTEIISLYDKDGKTYFTLLKT